MPNGCNVMGLWVLVIIAVCVPVAAQQTDPCQDYALIEDWKRSTGYTVESPETPLCDVNLKRGWYRFDSAAGGKMPETCPQRGQCGTLGPIWLRGSHPTTVGRVEIREACAHLSGGQGDNCCQKSVDIGVVNCEDFYVYALFPTPACPIAYCAGELETCPSGQYSLTGLPPCQNAHPDLTTAPTLTGPELSEDNRTFHFTCEIAFDGEDPKQRFEVHWVKAGDMDNPIKQEVIEEPNRVAYLENADMRGHYNSDIGCRVRAFYHGFPDETKGPWFRSNFYWAGVKAEPHQLEVSEAEGSRTVTVMTTVPVTCNWNHRPGLCCINIKLSAQKNVAFEHECESVICDEDWNPDQKRATVTFPVKATRDQMPQSQDAHLVLRFETEDLANSGIASNPNTVQVTVKDAPTATCNAWGDPHIRSIDQHTYEYHLFLLGDFTFFRKLENHFEVQIRTWACNTHVTCICGVAIRERDDVIRVDACDEWAVRHNAGATPEVSVFRPLSEGISVWQSSDGRNTFIYLPSSSEIKLEAKSYSHGGYMDITMTIPAIFKGGRGVCGTFDGNANNELTHKTGFVDTICNGGGKCVPHAFMESWRAEASLFKDDEVPDPLNDPGVYKYCICDNEDGEKYINCTARADITGKKMKISGPWYPLGREAMHMSPLWGKCSQNQAAPLIDIESCKLDVLASDGYEFLDSFRDGFTTSCQLELAKNPDNFVTNSEGESVLKPEISTDVCSSACLEHGRCDQNTGKCMCNAGYKGDTCQLLDGKGPQLNGVRGSAFCDINQRPCRRVYIDASNLEQSDDLACKVQEILPDGSVSMDRSNMMQEAEFVSSVKLACNLPDAQVKTERSVKRYTISATNDGTLYGNSVNLTVFDSVCRNCTQGGCYQLPDTCLINDLCHADGDPNKDDPSERCITAESTSHWIKIYPTVTADLTGPDNVHRVQCSVVTSDTDPSARYRVSWYLDGQRAPGTVEEELVNNATVTEIDRLTLPATGSLTCKVNSYYTNRNITSPDVESMAIDLASSPRYPAISVTLSGPGVNGAMVCTVNTSDTSDEARYKVSWYVDGQIFPHDRELGLPAGRTEAVYSRNDLPQSGALTCKMRSYYNGIDAFSPNVTSNAVDLALV